MHGSANNQGVENIVPDNLNVIPVKQLEMSVFMERVTLNKTKSGSGDGNG